MCAIGPDISLPKNAFFQAEAKLFRVKWSLVNAASLMAQPLFGQNFQEQCDEHFTPSAPYFAPRFHCPPKLS